MKKFFKDFMAFIKRGNVLDMAVGVIIGSAFTKIVSSLTNDLLMPLITFFVGENSLDSLSIVLRPGSDAVLNAEGEVIKAATDPLLFKYGVFLQTVLDFLLVALIVFIIVRIVTKVTQDLDYNRMMKQRVEAKYAKDLRLDSMEEKWVKRMEKKHPDMVPKKPGEEAPAEPPAPPAPTEAELLQSILDELKKNNQEKAE